MHQTVLELLQDRLTEKHGVPVKLEFSTKPFNLRNKFAHRLDIDITVGTTRFRNGVQTENNDSYLTVETSKGLMEAANDWIASRVAAAAGGSE